MAALAKVVDIYGMLLKLEASYGGGGTLAGATDGVELVEVADLALSVIHDGARGQNPANGRPRKRAVPAGFAGAITPRFEFRGLGSAYGAAAYVPDIHVPMRISGHSAVFTTNKWTFTPATTLAGLASGVAELYARGQKYVLEGIYADMVMTVEDNGAVFFDFPMQGMVDTNPTDVAVPAITYSSMVGPRAVGIALTIGGVAVAGVRRLQLNAGRTIFPRTDLNAADHGGFGLALRRQPTLEVTLEAHALATLNPYADHRSATARNLAFQVGAGGANNALTFAATNAQLREPPAEEADESAALHRLVFDLVEDYTLEAIA